MDAGPIIAQAVVPVMAGDTVDDLSARILSAEHKLYPHALRLVASGAAWIEGEKVRYASPESCRLLLPRETISEPSDRSSTFPHRTLTIELPPNPKKL
jgi:methionyl-tRNA formyltransferase